MATGQTLLNWMEILFPELQLQSGEADVTKGLLALNAAQDMLETHLVQFPDVMGSGTTDINTTANQEYTTYPTGLLRIDAIDMLDSASEVEYRLTPAKETGGHAFNRPWPWNVMMAQTSGRPSRFWTNASRIYWDPTPDGVETLRVYGLIAASDITAGGTFAYPDICIVPLSVLAVKLLRIGLDDPVENYMNLSRETFNPVLEALDRFNRTGPSQYHFTRRHDT